MVGAALVTDVRSVLAALFAADVPEFAAELTDDTTEDTEFCAEETADEIEDTAA